MPDTKEIEVEMGDDDFVAFAQLLYQFAQRRGMVPVGAVGIGIKTLWGDERPVIVFDVVDDDEEEEGDDDDDGDPHDPLHHEVEQSQAVQLAHPYMQSARNKGNEE